jgi:hypothetical protein
VSVIVHSPKYNVNILGVHSTIWLGICSRSLNLAMTDCLLTSNSYDYLLNLSILIGRGIETNQDSPSSGE